MGCPSPAARRRSAGYTLIELLVTIAIIVLLVGLLMPGVQKVRESAARTKCTNNLKQLALTFHQYEASFRRLPTAGSNASGNPPTDRRDWGWTYEILPLIEQDNLRTVPTADIRRAVLPLYHCPSKRSATLHNGRAVADYAGCGGSNVGADAVLNGVVVKTGSAKIVLADDIPDGISNTIMLGEKRVNFATMAGLNGEDHSDNEAWAGPGYPTGDIMRGALPNGSSWYTPARDYSEPGDTAAVQMRTQYRFGSSHPGGVMFALADASVRPVRYEVSPVMFRRQCDRNDRQPVSFDD